MKRNTIWLSYLAMICFLLVVLNGCAFPPVETAPSTLATTSPTELQATIPPPPPEIPPQPIAFDCVSLAVAFLSSPDYSAYREDWHYAYQHMVATFQQDGYLYTVSHSEAPLYQELVYLYPEVKYEDVGISYYFLYEEQIIRVEIHNVKSGEEFAIDINTEDYSDYHMKRLGTETAGVVHTKHPQLSMMHVSTGRLSCMIDETHHIQICSDADSEIIIRFIEGLSISSVPIG